MLRHFGLITLRQWIAILHLALALSIPLASDTGLLLTLKNLGVNPYALSFVFILSAVGLCLPIPILPCLLPLATLGVVGSLLSGNLASIAYLPGIVLLIIWAVNNGHVYRIPIFVILGLYMLLLGIGILTSPNTGAAMRINALYAIPGVVFGSLFIFGALVVLGKPSRNTLRIVTFPLLLYSGSIIGYSIAAHSPASPLAITVTGMFFVTIYNIFVNWGTEAWTSHNGSGPSLLV